MADDDFDAWRASIGTRVRQNLAQYFTGFNQVQNAAVPQSAGDAANMALYATPGVGTALSANDTYNALGNRNWQGAALSAAGMIPFVGAYIDTVDVAGGRITADWQPDY